MEKEKNTDSQPTSSRMVDDNFFGRLWDESWIYIKTVVDVVREPVLILDKDFCVMAANEAFYRTFQVERKDTEGTIVYKLGNGQWDISALRKLLEEILPHNTFFNGFEVSHVFPSIGRKVMILNARQIHCQQESQSKHFPQIILLAFEDVTDMMSVADSLAEQIRRFETDFSDRTGILEAQVTTLEKQIKKIKNRI